MEKDRKKKIITLLVIVFVTTLSIAYAAVSRTLSINGTAKMDTANWDVHFDNLSKANLINTAEEVNEPNYADNKGTIENINVKLKNPKDEVIYTVDIVNDGTMDAEVTVTSITNFSEEESKLLDFGVYYSDGTKITKYDLLEAGQKKEVTIKLRYKDDITEFDLPEVPLTISFGFTINYIQSDASMVVTPNGDLENVVSTLDKGGGSSTSTFFNGNITKESVETISFLSTLKVPKEVQSTAWDASLNKDGSVIAWYTDLNENGLYELNIGGNGKVHAPSDSSSLFRSFTKLETINFNNVFDTSNVTSMGYMFSSSRAITSLNLSSFDTSKVTNMKHMFYDTPSLVYIDLSNWNTSNVINMNSMFQECNITELDLSSFNTSNVLNMDSMFYGCSKLSKINLSSFNTSNVTSMLNMFRGCALTELDISNFNTSKVTNMERMFIYNSKLKNLNLNNFDTSNVKNMFQMFYSCSSLIELKVDNFNTESVTTMGSMFSNCSSLNELDLSSFNALNVINMNAMFSGCIMLERLDISNINTINVTNISGMFSGCKSLNNLNLNKFYTINVETANSLFSNCSSLIELDVSSFNTGKMTTMYAMFNGCSSLTNLDLNNFDTSNVTNMSYMFSNCTSLTELDLSGFDTINVTDMASMFHTCSSLLKINFKNVNFSSTTSYFSIFTNCTLLKDIDISGVTSDKYSNDNFKGILSNLGSGKTVYVLNEECVALGQSINANLNYIVKSA